MVEADAAPSMAKAEGEEWPEFEDEDEIWPAEEEEAPNDTEVAQQRPGIVKGEVQQKDEVDGAAGVTDAADEERGDDFVEGKKEEQPEAEEEEDAEFAEVFGGDGQEAAIPTKEQPADMPEYEPTSPASDVEGLPVERRPERTAPVRPRKEEKVVPCPVLLVGSQFNKECLLKHGRWVEVGRQLKAHILLQNPAVSKHHCKMQWRKGASSVELRMLDGVTHVNDRRLTVGSTVSLKHGDLLRIYGKGVCFRFLVDMRKIDETLPEIRSMPNYMTATKESQHSSRTPEEELQRKVRKIRALAAAQRENAMKYEERLTEIQTQRTLRQQQMKEDGEKSNSFEKDGQRLEDLLFKSREEWIDRLRTQSELAEKVGRPLSEQTTETQLQRNTLQVLYKQEDRRLHPERHIALPEPSSGPPVVHMELTDRAKHEAKADEADGEEEAFPDAPARGLGLKDEKDEKLLKPTVEVLKTAPTGADDDINIADLFGDFDSDEEAAEQASKKPRLRL